ncbi:MAG: hypothetical protein QM796_13110 [Chthoniobacteraceae bacterium]
MGIQFRLPVWKRLKFGHLRNLSRSGARAQQYRRGRGGNNSCYALDSSGYVWAWGGNDVGQLGNGSTSTYVAAPAKVKTASSTYLSGIAAIASHYKHVLTFKSSDSTVWSWGVGTSGQLAYNGSHSSSSYAILSRAALVNGSYTSLNGAYEVSAGQSHSGILKSDGTTYMWGDDTQNQLGDGSTTQEVYPIKITTSNFPELGNHTPSVTLAISGGPYYQTGALTLTGSPTDPDAITGVTNGLSEVDFYDGSTWLGSLNSSPWSLNINQPTLGNHSYSAIVTDAVGATASSSQLATTVVYDPTLDTDGDGIPDVWEMQYGLNINDPTDASVIPNGNGLTYLDYYLLGLNPTVLDSNSNNIPDGMDDANGDGIPDSWEPIPSTSAFTPTFVVDANGGGDFVDLQSAINAITADYQSIQVNDGCYTGAIAAYGYKIFIYAKNGASKTILALDGSTAGFYVSSNCIIRGFTIRDGAGDIGDGNISGGNIFVDQASPIFERCVITNGQGDDGAAIANNYGNPVFVNCTIFGNQAANTAVYSWGHPAVFNDCILWDSSSGAEAGGVGINAQQSIVFGGSPGSNSSSNPLLGMAGHLLVGSPAIDAGGSLGIAGPDMDGEAIHGTAVDIGADEYWDSDNDGLPDWWELLNAGAGLDPNNATDAQTDPDGIGSNFLQTYQSLSNQN